MHHKRTCGKVTCKAIFLKSRKMNLFLRTKGIELNFWNIIYYEFGMLVTIIWSDDKNEWNTLKQYYSITCFNALKYCIPSVGRYVYKDIHCNIGKANKTKKPTWQQLSTLIIKQCNNVTKQCFVNSYCTLLFR